MNNIKKSAPFLFVALLFLLPASAAGRELSWDFRDRGGLRDWKGEGIKAGGIKAGVLMIAGGEKVTLTSPPGLRIKAAGNPYLRIRLRTNSPRVAQFYWIPAADGQGWPALTFQPARDGRFHTYRLDLSRSPDWSGEIRRFGLIFQGRPGLIEIDSITLGPFSLGRYLADQWTEFRLPRRLTPGTINSLNSPRLFGGLFIGWLLKIAFLAVLIGLFFYLRAAGRQKIKVISRAGLVLLALWIVYDIRETYSEVTVGREIYQSYLQPPPGQKSFPVLGDFYRFVDFCRGAVPRKAVFQLLPQPFWPFDCRLKYFLYPSWIESEKTGAYVKRGYPFYYIVYRAPFIRFDPSSRTLVRQSDHARLTPPGKITARYNPDSFVFKVD